MLLLICALTTTAALGAEVREQRVPQALIIGVKKGGTRALLEYLRINNAIRAPGPEVHFFDRYYDRGIDWYRRQMPYTYSNETTVEKTPSYFVTKAAPVRIHDVDPSMKLILVVRDPVTRALSDYAQTASKRPMPTFEHMAFVGDAVNKSWGAIRLGIYHRHLIKWLRHFDRRQILVIDGQQLIDDPVVAVRQTEEFLALTPSVTENDFVRGRKFPCIRMKRSIASTQNNSEDDAHCLGSTKGRQHPMLSAEHERLLRQFYALHNEEFYRLIGKRFDW